jgi:hypothetical protein
MDKLHIKALRASLMLLMSLLLRILPLLLESLMLLALLASQDMPAVAGALVSQSP